MEAAFSRFQFVASRALTQTALEHKPKLKRKVRKKKENPLETSGGRKRTDGRESLASFKCERAAHTGRAFPLGGSERPGPDYCC